MDDKRGFQMLIINVDYKCCLQMFDFKCEL